MASRKMDPPMYMGGAFHRWSRVGEVVSRIAVRLCVRTQRGVIRRVDLPGNARLCGRPMLDGDKGGDTAAGHRLEANHG